jgi:hypothetical protein
MFDRSYVLELENLIMDELLPMYIAGCRSTGRTPNTSEILKKLTQARSRRSEYPALLDKDFSVNC